MNNTVGKDYIIVVRKGIRDQWIRRSAIPSRLRRELTIPTNNPGGMGAPNGYAYQPMGGQDGIGQRAPQGGPSQPQVPQIPTQTLNTDDSLEVFDGRAERRISASRGGSTRGQDGLHSHNVPVVESFKKAVLAADKAAAAAAVKTP